MYWGIPGLVDMVYKTSLFPLRHFLFTSANTPKNDDIEYMGGKDIAINGMH